MGLINYYWRFMANLSSILTPLNDLLKKGPVWRWESREADAFQESKEALKAADLVVHYDTKLDLVVKGDASPDGLGAVLSHVMPDGSQRPVS